MILRTHFQASLRFRKNWKGCVISKYKLQSGLPYCLIKQVNKILGIQNSEIWLFDDMSKILIVNIGHKNLNIYLFNFNTFPNLFFYWRAFVKANHFCQCQSLTKVSCNNVFSLSFIPRQTENKEEIRDFSSISYRPSRSYNGLK